MRLSLNEAVKFLSNNIDEVRNAWMCPATHTAGALFDFCSPTKSRYGDTYYGCITMVHSKSDIAASRKITQGIRDDARLHNNIDEIHDALIECDTIEERIDILRPYAEWQQRMNKLWTYREKS